MHVQWLVLAAILAMMVVDHFVVWRSFTRRRALDETRARHAFWLRIALLLWATSALVLWLWIAHGVPLSSVGFAAPVGWRLWAPLVLGSAVVLLQAQGALKVARLAAPGPKLRAQLGGAEPISPHLASELPAFFGLSLTAGFCEELLFRGFVVWVLQPALGLWIAAALAALLFALGHAYQGVQGVVRTGIIGLVFTAIVLVTRSLWPAIVLHAAIDAMGGVLAWLILRERPVMSAGAAPASTA